MASNFIPMLSSSPPPLDDCPDDDDEEFGTFTSANIAFDSSFDSPVAGEKYKNFLKTGENGINDLNSFELPTQNYNLKFSQQNQNSHINNVLKNKRDNKDKIVSNSDSKVPDECRTSTKELNAKNIDCSETSHISVPEDKSDSSDAYKENDRSKRKLFSEKSNERIIPNSIHSNVNCSDDDDSMFVPPSDEIEVTGSSKDVNIPCAGDSLQSTDLSIPNCDDSISYGEIGVNGSIRDYKNVQKSINDGENKIETPKDKFETCFPNEENGSFEEDFDDFQVVESFSDISDRKGVLLTNESVNEDESLEAFQGTASLPDVEGGLFFNKPVNEDESFEAFQGAPSLPDVEGGLFFNKPVNEDESFEAFQGAPSLPDVEGGLFFNKSVNEDESFEANFDDFQSFENKQNCESSKFQSASPAVFVPLNEEQSNDDDEFADFKAASNEKCHSDNDEFDDFKAASDEKSPSVVNEFDNFQSFHKPGDNISSDLAASNKSTVKPLNIDNSSNSFRQPAEQDDFDDFDDFQACSEVAVPAEEEFAAFKEEPTTDKDGSDSPEFADFERASFSSASGETYPNSPCLSSSSHNQEKTVDKLSTVMNAIFPLQVEPNEDVSNDLESEIVDQSIKGRRLWEKLHEAEQTPGLRFQWGVSHSFQQLLRSVNVDYHSILRTSSVPIFASGLSLLEPVKGQTSSANLELDDKPIPSPRDPIPPVEFDWNTSGLVNPLDTGQSASILMDLSFLSSTSTNSSSTVTEDHSFESELLKPSPTDAFPETNNKTFILEELLSKNLSSIPDTNITHRPTNLSEEANAVLDQLPDLSYMRAKVLMFPIT
ncbi:hypothetical protein JTE90_020659 [Oedothorax gibbosus]|uniref:Aftiphilin clathrin-binding box domain-containing protein n=1 Tax=Oedothorax gibbosus TaxID=931172 RepID=A0AAV6URY5_9ARAC|nr:hypothetical protein JTE90_020659 [Oedothorax gibbosus]